MTERRVGNLGALVFALLVLAAWFGFPTPKPTRASDIQPRVVFRAFDIPVTSGAAICTASLTPSVAGVAYRVTIIPNTTNFGVLLAVTCGSKTMTGEFNSGTDLTAGNVYTFVFGGTKLAALNNDTVMSYNLQPSASSRVAYILIEEIQGGEL